MRDGGLPDCPHDASRRKQSGISFSVSHAGTKTADKAKKTGKIQTHGTGWTVSRPFSTRPGTLDRWQLVQFTFSSKHSDAQLYDFYVDPRMGADRDSDGIDALSVERTRCS